MFKKDDIESLVYMLINIAKGELPWFNLPIVEGENYANIFDCKINTTAEEICKGLPDAFKDMYNYVRNLHNQEKVDYEKIQE